MDNILVDTSIVKQERLSPPLGSDGNSHPIPLVIAPISFSGDRESPGPEVQVQNGTPASSTPLYRGEQAPANPLLTLSVDNISRKAGKTSTSDALSTKVTAVDKEGTHIDDEYQAFGFIYRDPVNSAKSYLCNFCNYISISRKDFMQHSLIHVVQCGSCRFKAFTRLEVIRHTSKYHPNKMHTFDNLQQLNIEWKCKNISSETSKTTSKSKTQTVSSSKPSSTVSDSVHCTLDEGPPTLIRQVTPTQSNTWDPAMSSTLSSDLASNADLKKALSDPSGLINWAIDQGKKMPDYVQSILGSSGALISELKYMMRIVKRSGAKYGCIACEDFQCNQYIEFKMHMRERHQFPQSKMWECGNCNQKFNTARDLLRHMKAKHNRPFEQNCLCVRLPWLVETSGSSPVNANRTDPKCGNCNFAVKTSFARYWHRMLPHKKWMHMPDGGTPLHHAAMVWDVIQTRFDGCTEQACDEIMKIMFDNIEKLTKNWPLSKYYPLSNKSTNIVTWPLTLIDRLKLLCHMKANHPEDWLITVNHKGSNKIMVETRPVRPHSKTQNYIMDNSLWNTKGETMLEAFGSPEHGTSLTLPISQPKPDVVTLLIGDPNKGAPSNLISVLKPIQPPPLIPKPRDRNSPATKEAEARPTDKTKFVSPLLTAGMLPSIPPIDYEEPDPILDYIDPQKRELIDVGYQETITLKNALGVEGVECTVVYYRETAQDLLINHREHYIVKSGKDGVACAQCKQCNKTLQGKNAVAHMRDHVAGHTGGRLYECAYCDRQALRPGLMCDHVRKMHPNRVLLIVKRKARVTGAGESNSGYSGAEVYDQNVSSSEDSQIVTSTQQIDAPPKPSPKRVPAQRRVPLGPKKIIFPASSLVISDESSDDEEEENVWRCQYCSRLFEEKGPAYSHISATHAPGINVMRSVLEPLPQRASNLTRVEMKNEAVKLKYEKLPMVTLHRIPKEKIKGTENLESSDNEESKSSKAPKKTERLGRSPMVAYIGQLYRDKKGDNEKVDGQKNPRTKVLPPPHYDHWDVDSVPLKCSQCEFQSTHEVIKGHYRAEHLRIFPTAFDLEAKQKRKKYTVFLCPSTGCGFATYWKEVINHHTNGHRFNRNEIDGLIFKVFGDKVGFSSNRKRKPNEDESDDTSPQRTKKKRRIDESHAQSSEVVGSTSEVTSHVVSSSNSNKSSPGKTSPKGTAKNNSPVPSAKAITLKLTIKSPTKGKDSQPNKGQSVEKQNVTKGKVVLDRVIKARREVLKSSTVAPVLQKGGVMRSVQLSKHPILLGDLKMDRSQYTESVFHERFVCPYCTVTRETAIKVRKHIIESHKGKDPTVIDRLSYVRKQRSKTFFCWNPDCAFQTAVCEERESHIETGDCGSVYEKKFGEAVPSVRDKKTKSSVIPSVVSIRSQGTHDKGKTDKMRSIILKLFDKHKSQTLERTAILKALGNCTNDELSNVLRIMVEESEVVCSGSLVFTV